MIIFFNKAESKTQKMLRWNINVLYLFVEATKLFYTPCINQNKMVFRLESIALLEPTRFSKWAKTLNKQNE